MRSLTLLTIFFFFFTALNATTHTTVKSGDWDDVNIWSTGQVPNISSWPGDEVIINHKVEVDGNLSFKQGASMTINANASLEIDGDWNLQGEGTFIIAQNANVSCDDVRHTGYGGSISVQGTLEAEDISVSGVAQFYNDGSIYADNLEIKGSGNFDSKGGLIQVAEEWTITGGTAIKISNTDVVIEEDFTRTGGPSIEFTGGTMSVGDVFTGKGGGSICFNGTIVNVTNETDLRGSVKVYVGGRGSFTSEDVNLTGTAAILGKDMGGWVNCVSMSISGSAKVECVDGGCMYDDENADEMPSQLDLGAGTNTVLPVELLYFEANVKADGMLVVSWATAIEVNNDFFTIEMSLNGKDWKGLDEVKGAGNSDVELAYEWKNADINAAGTTYLRLKQTDFDGSFSYSDIESVTFSSKEAAQFEVNVFPNPATEYIIIEGIGADVAPQITLVNMQGQRMLIPVTDEGFNTRVDIPSYLPAGTYGLVIENGGQIDTQQLIIQK
ncbi:MAG: T9SS type A sorting domain-containing protein [Saprospiraceae bacterium]|nr:T9SS type A sorting domain-containing protein [Saprospiraceae bacterium]